MTLLPHFSRMLLMFGMAASGPALATADGPDYYRLSVEAPATERVMRGEPRHDAPSVLSLPADAQCLRSMGCQGGLSLQEFSSLSDAEKQQRQAANPRWCKLAYQGSTGWVEARFLAEAPCSDATAPDQRVVAVNFSGQVGSKAIKDRLKGREFVDYQLEGRAGQTLDVALKGSNGQNYFNVNPPGTALAMFVGSTSGDRFTRQLPVDGIYTVRVYLMRAAARRNEVSRYTVSFRLSGQPLAPRPAHRDAVLPGTPYHASATVACAYDAPALSQRCEAFVIRRGFAGAATLEVRWPAGALIPMRRILFVRGVPVASDSADPLTHSRQGDMTTIRIGDQESVEVPDALIVGG